MDCMPSCLGPATKGKLLVRIRRNKRLLNFSSYNRNGSLDAMSFSLTALGLKIIMMSDMTHEEEKRMNGTQGQRLLIDNPVHIRQGIHFFFDRARDPLLR